MRPQSNHIDKKRAILNQLLNINSHLLHEYFWN